MAQAFFDLSLIDGENGFIINGQQENELLGSSVSQLGDINSDGINDLIIGAPRRDDTDDRPFTGAAYVVFGQNEFSTNFELSALDGSNGFILQGVNTEDGTGSSVSDAGDVNGDGIADLIIGAPSAGEIVEDIYGDNVNDRRGASYLFFGNDSGFNSIVDLADLDGSNGFLLSGINFGDRLGKSVSGVGDFNRDGFDDVIVGAPSYNYQDEYGGNSYLIFGQADGFAADIDLTIIDGSNGFVIQGVDGGDTSGFSVSGAGDVNGDGFDDAIVGAPNADPVESEGYYNTTEGASYVVFGGTEVGSDGSFELANLDGSNGFAINGEDVINLPESSGFSVSGAGDINGDGFDDLIIGAAYGGVHSRNFSATYVVFGQAEAFNSSLDVSALDGNNGFTIDSLSGVSVSGAGDINGDGFNDLILGHFSHGDNFGTPSPFVLFGKSEQFAPVLTDSDFDGNQGFIPALSSDGYGREFYGDSVSEAGDINNDGVDDLIIGSSHTNSSYVIFGQADGFAPQIDLDNREPDSNFTAYFSGSPVPIVGVNLTLSDPDSPNLSSARVTITNFLDGEAEVLTVDTSNTNITASYDRQTGTLSLTGTDAIANYEQVLQTVTYNNSADSPNSEARLIEFVITDDAESPKESVVATTTLNLQGGFNIADLDGSNGFVINGIDPSGRSGSSVSSAGDFNGDGIDDVIVGAKFVNYDGGITGQSYVLFGSSNEFAADFHLDDLNGSNGFALNGLPGDRSGSSVNSAGDVNGDGLNDIIIGAYTGGDNQQGKSYVVFGAESGFAAEFDLSSLDGNNGFAISGFESNLGKSVSGAGDINNDGFDDIIVGSSEKSAVVFGAENGFAAEFDLSSLDGNNGFTFLSNNFLSSVSEAGDVNGDGIDDLIIGGDNHDELDQSYVVFGSESEFSAEFDLSLLDGNNGFALNGVETNRDLGSSVSSAGDINADGIDDLIIRASESSYVIFGSATGFNANFDLTTIDGSNGFVINGLSQNDFSGSSVGGAGDFNGDGIDDVIVGSLGDAIENYVIFGSNDGFSPSLNVNTIDSSQGLVLRGIDDNESFGVSVSGAGDINNDGVDDLIIGAESGDVEPDLTSAGKSYVVFGNAYLTLDLNGSNADVDLNPIFEGETIAIVDSGLTV
ncbi:beta strand repeat-containing protein, partial [Hyella patelloides]|uniref:beta strand repeat-containing protein n=1 Tax=Hyella patelloides TaxID=1982969 RepID=UPI00119E4093